MDELRKKIEQAAEDARRQAWEDQVRQPWRKEYERWLKTNLPPVPGPKPHYFPPPDWQPDAAS